MQKTFFVVFLLLVFGLFFLSCEKGTNPMDSMDTEAVASEIETPLASLDPGCCSPPPCEPCEPKSPGYWKNHPDAWPCKELEVGGIVYDKDHTIHVLNMPVKGNKLLTMFKALVAAKLNYMMGCKCIEGLIKDADNWMIKVFKECEQKKGTHWPYVKASSKYWQCDGEDLYLKLDWFNNHGSCK
jgi:hypothetical protein